MKNLVAKMTCAALSLTLCLAPMAGCGEKSVDGTAEAMVVNGESVNMGVANFLLRYQQAQMQSLYASYYSQMGYSDTSIWSMELEEGGTYGETFKADIQDTIAKLYMLRQNAEDYDVTVTEEELAAIDKAAEAFMAANKEEDLTKMGVSEEDVATALELYTYQEKMYEPLIADTDREVTDEEAAQTTITYVKVSTAGTETDDDGNTIELTDDEKAAKKDLAQKVLDAVLASEDVAAADLDEIAGGIDDSLYGTTSSYGSDDTLYDETLKETAKSMTDGEVYAEVLEGADGNYYVVRLDAAFDEDKTEIEKQNIIEERESARFTEVLTEWLEEAEVTVSKAWKKLEVTDYDVYTIVVPETDTESESTTGGATEAEDTTVTESGSTADDTAETETEEGTDE